MYEVLKDKCRLNKMVHELASDPSTWHELFGTARELGLRNRRKLLRAIRARYRARETGNWWFVVECTKGWAVCDEAGPQMFECDLTNDVAFDDSFDEACDDMLQRAGLPCKMDEEIEDMYFDPEVPWQERFLSQEELDEEEP